MPAEQSGFTHVAEHRVGDVHVAPVGHMQFEDAVLVVSESQLSSPCRTIGTVYLNI